MISMWFQCDFNVLRFLRKKKDCPWKTQIIFWALKLNFLTFLYFWQFCTDILVSFSDIYALEHENLQFEGLRRLHDGCGWPIALVTSLWFVRFSRFLASQQSHKNLSPTTKNNWPNFTRQHHANKTMMVTRLWWHRDVGDLNLVTG